MENPLRSSNNNEDIEETTKEVISSNEDIGKIINLVVQLKDPAHRENALIELSRKRETFPDLAIYLWYSPGIIPSLLQEIIGAYKLLAPANLSIQASNHTCNVLALFQCIAANSETRQSFLNAQIPIFLYPFLNTVNKNKPYEYLRLTALGVIGALVKVDNPEVINFLLSTEIIPLCLRIMEKGSELSKTVATFIVQRILLDDNGLSYICNNAERFYAVSSVLYNIMTASTSPRLVKHIIRCYARLAENGRVKAILKENIPAIFKDKSFQASLEETSKRWLQSLLKALEMNNTTSGASNTMVTTGGTNGSPKKGPINSTAFEPKINNMTLNQMNAMGSMQNIPPNLSSLNSMNTIPNNSYMMNGNFGNYDMYGYQNNFVYSNENYMNYNYYNNNNSSNTKKNPADFNFPNK